MKNSLRSHEGYLLIDHRATLTGQGALFEAPTYTCSHCGTVVVINPARTRERPYCRKCDHRICDACEQVRVATGECRTLNQIIDDLQDAAVLR